MKLLTIFTIFFLLAACVLSVPLNIEDSLDIGVIDEGVATNGTTSAETFEQSPVTDADTLTRNCGALGRFPKAMVNIYNQPLCQGQYVTMKFSHGSGRCHGVHRAFSRNIRSIKVGVDARCTFWEQDICRGRSVTVQWKHQGGNLDHVTFPVTTWTCWK